MNTMNLKDALRDPLWLAHRIGDKYEMVHANGKVDANPWKIAYYPIMQGDGEPKALVEKPILNGTDFREIPLRYLKRLNLAETRLNTNI